VINPQKIGDFLRIDHRFAFSSFIIPRYDQSPCPVKAIKIARGTW
jgi:hypothetical protein